MAAVLDAPWIESDDIAGRTEPDAIRTTLFDLIAALQDATGPGDDATVVAAVAALLQAGRIRFLDGAMQSS